MNIQDLKHKRKIKQTLDQIDFRGIDPFFLVSSEKKSKRSKKVKKKNQEIFTNASKIGS